MNLFLRCVLVFFMTVSGTFGALFFKNAMAKNEGRRIFALIAEPQLYFGGVCYLLGALLNILLLRYMDYSILYPMTSLTYIWTMIVSYLVLKEKINTDKLIAVALIVSGVVVLNF